MYLIVFLLISPAFGRPGSAQLDVVYLRDVEQDISNPFNYIHNSTALKEAGKNLLELERGLKTIKAKKLARMLTEYLQNT